MITTVPSKRGKSYSEQPLRLALAMARDLSDLLAPALAYQRDPNVVDLRGSYYPQCFHPDGKSARRERIVLVEDTWVSGATAASAAGSLREQGADSVLTVPIARVLDTHYWESNPYVTWINQQTEGDYESMPWPRR